jgi:hypothetical protein
MALTREFKELVVERVRRDAGFRKALLCEARASVDAQLISIQRGREELREIDLERRNVLLRSPRQDDVEHCRAFVFRSPAFDQSGVGIDDPVLRDAFALVRRPLDCAISACRGLRQHLRDETERTCFSPRPRPPLAGIA